MRINLLLLLCMYVAISMRAQTNPQTGYVITNSGDTIHGTIDYLPDARNAVSCLFKKNGGSEFITYAPKDIRAYRLANNGIYYVSRIFAYDGKEAPMFAEFLIQGGVSLYRFNVSGCDYYQFVNSNGETAMLKDDGLKSDINYQDKLQSRKSSMQNVAHLLYKSPQLLNKLWKSELSAENVANIVKAYNEEFCTEEGDCILFHYDYKKAASISYRLFVGAGIGYGDYWYSAAGFRSWFSGISPKIIVGAELIPLRTKQHWLFSLTLGYSRLNIKSELATLSNKEKPKMELIHFDVDLGATYYVLSKTSKVRPFLRGGVSSTLLSGIKVKNVYSSDVYTDADAQAISNYHERKSGKVGIGWFIGTGVDLGRFRIGADYKQCYMDAPENHPFYSATVAMLF